jgi:hypothetical protein
MHNIGALHQRHQLIALCINVHRKHQIVPIMMAICALWWGGGLENVQMFGDNSSQMFGDNSAQMFGGNIVQAVMHSCNVCTFTLQECTVFCSQPGGP